MVRSALNGWAEKMSQSLKLLLLNSITEKHTIWTIQCSIFITVCNFVDMFAY